LTLVSRFVNLSVFPLLYGFMGRFSIWPSYHRKLVPDQVVFRKSSVLAEDRATVVCFFGFFDNFENFDHVHMQTTSLSRFMVPSSVG